MIASLLLFAVTSFCNTKVLLVQIELDKAGFSCNTIDGSWGEKSKRAFLHYITARTKHNPNNVSTEPEKIYSTFFKNTTSPFSYVTVTQEDINSIVKIPCSPSDKANLNYFGYESIAEMFAEKGHLSRRALERLNPQINWKQIAVGTKIKIPYFPPIKEELSVWPKNRKNAPQRPEATHIRISLSKCEITALSKSNEILAVFPCSIAKNKANLPPHGELKITTTIANPNYTYTPQDTNKSRYIFPEGPNCPVGVAWLGLNLPGYGIHGTPNPESIGTAESHGCFRLSNWNAARLYALVKSGTRVTIEK